MTKFAVGVATDVGQVRQVNQDNTLVAEDVFAVADGMGGHRGGEVASLVAVEALQASFVDRTTDALVDAVQRANEAIVERARDDPDLRGMGTTMCALARVYLDDGEEILTVVNVGDSRAYLLKAGESELVQISEDHSLVQTLFRQGQLTQAEAAVHPQRNILTRALGIDQRVLPDSFDLLPVKGDRYLLCSDGLFNEVEEPRIAEILVELTDPQEASDELVRLANEGGGRDNISVVVVDVIDDAGHHKLLTERSADDRVVSIVHGPERVGLPPEDGPRQASTSPDSNGNGAAAVPAAVAPPAMAQAPAAPDGRHAEVASVPQGSVLAPAPAPPVAPPMFAPAAASSRSRFTWRVGAFLVVIIAIFAVGAFAVHWVANNTYFVGVDNNEVVIFQGHPGGFLWYQPTVAKRTGVNVAEVPAEFQPDVVQGKTEPTMEDAAAYIARLIAARPTTTTTTSTTTSTSPAVTSPSTIKLPGAGGNGGLGGEVTGGATTTTTRP